MQRLWRQDGAAQRMILLGSVALCWAMVSCWQAAGAEEPQSFRTARWIAFTADAGAAQSARMPLFRRSFLVGKPLRKATLLIAGLGQFEAHVNGRNVTDALLTPGWTDYRKRVFYDSYDVTKLVHRGENAVGVMLGNGMYNVVETKGRYTKFAASMGPPKLIAELRLLYTDGSTEVVVSDGSWKAAPGPITFTSIFGGEDYDARLEQPGWDAARFADAGWSAAVAVEGPGGELQPETVPPVKAFERYMPVRLTRPRAGVTVYDLGQNFAGWPEIAVTGERGAAVTLTAGELLDEHGTVTQRSAHAFADSRNAFTYVLRGGAEERWHPRFSYYGFRYVQVETAGGAVKVSSLSGRALHDDVRVDGTFTSSDGLMNRIHQLIDRAMLSNMMSVLTDCPHREKLGWLEQTHLAGPSLMYNYGLAALYAKMADDMQDSQLPSGLVPSIAPEYPVFGGAFRDSPEWGSAVVLSAWTDYQFYGDVEVLRAHYGSMQRYAAYLKGRLQGGLLLYGLGDWYDIGPGDPGPSKLTGKGLTATATYYELLTDMEKIASLLGKQGDADLYAADAAATKAAFNRRYFHAETGEYDTGSQTANAMPLVVGLVADEARAAVLANLVADIERHGNHVTAGDVGFHYLVRALTDGGRSDVLYAMLSRTDKPSYGDQLAHGATTLTEAWDANPDDSQNHFMLGHAEEWFYRGLAGIDVDMSRVPGERIRLQPAVVGEMKSAAAAYQSGAGRIASGWKRTGEGLLWTVTVPRGERATVVLPRGYRRLVRLNGKAFRSSSAFRALAQEEDGTGFSVKGGVYRLVVER